MDADDDGPDGNGTSRFDNGEGATNILFGTFIEISLSWSLLLTNALLLLADCLLIVLLDEVALLGDSLIMLDAEDAVCATLGSNTSSETNLKVGFAICLEITEEIFRFRDADNLLA